MEGTLDTFIDQCIITHANSIYTKKVHIKENYLVVCRSQLNDSESIYSHTQQSAHIWSMPLSDVDVPLKRQVSLYVQSTTKKEF